MKKGYSLSFKGKCCIIKDSHGVDIAKVEMLNDRFPLVFYELNMLPLLQNMIFLSYGIEDLVS